MRPLYKKLVASLVIAGILAAPIAVVPAGFELQTAEAQFGGIPSPGDLAEKIIPDELINGFCKDNEDTPEDECEQQRKKIEESLAKGVAACAIATALALIIGQALSKVPVDDPSQNFKENFLDCITYQVINALIESMLRSLTAWVQGGFKGNPVFVTNSNRFARDVADNQFSAYIEEKFQGEGLPFFCTPFAADLQLQLTLLYQESRDTHRYNYCTLSDSVENVQNFMEGDFLAGGWEGWTVMFANPNNNPYGAYFEARSELADRIRSQVDQQEKEADQGKGFLGKKVQDCYLVDLATGERTKITDDTDIWETEGQVQCDEPRTVTPGAFVEEQIQNKYNIPDERLTFADELNELINAVILFMVSSILTEAEEGLAKYDVDSHQNVELTPPTLPGGGGPTGDTEPAGPPGPAQCFVKRGVFLSPESGDEETKAAFSFPLPENVSYERVELEMDIDVDWEASGGGLDPADGSPIHNIFYFWRGHDSRDNFGYGNVFAQPKKLWLKQQVGVPFATPGGTVDAAANIPNGSMHAQYVYDTKARTVTFTLSGGKGGEGTVLGRVTKVPDTSAVNVGDERFFATVGFGTNEGRDREAPSYGWSYSNLKVQFLNGTTEPETCQDAPAGPGDRPPLNPRGDDDDVFDPTQ